MPPTQSRFTTILQSEENGAPGVSIKRIQTSAGYNSNPVTRHLVGLHLGTPVQILHQRGSNEALHHFKPGDVVFTPAGSPVHYAHNGGVDGLYVEITPDHLRDVAAQIDLSERFALRDVLGVADPIIYRIGLDYLREVNTSAAGSRLYLDTLNLQLALHLLRHYSDHQNSIVTDDTDQQQRLRPALDYIHDHLSDDLSLAQIAATVHLNPAYFSRLFRQTYHVSPYQYVIRQRVEAAHLLLQNPQRTVSEVALQVGFADHSHLTRHYKRLLGRTPRN